VEYGSGEGSGVLECWSVGVLECWSVGVLECWSVGVLECWSVGVLECWSAGVLECWSAGVLECWSAGVLGGCSAVKCTISKRIHLTQHGTGRWLGRQPDPITPLFHHSITPSLHYSATPFGLFLHPTSGTLTAPAYVQRDPENLSDARFRSWVRD
jgi:hypothetical protein